MLWGINTDKKDTYISIRTTARNKEMFQKKAEQNGKSLNEYIEDAAIAGCERRRDKDKKRLMCMMECNELMNRIYLYINNSDTDIPSELKEMLEKLMEGENKLWQY